LRKIYGFINKCYYTEMSIISDLANLSFSDADKRVNTRVVIVTSKTDEC